MGERGWVKRFTEAGRTGAYLSVVAPGVLSAGDAVSIERPGHEIDLLLTFRAFMGDLDAARLVLAAGVLNDVDHRGLAEDVERRAG
jgi:MOSC domain-containing protein YiiM